MNLSNGTNRRPESSRSDVAVVDLEGSGEDVLIDLVSGSPPTSDGQPSHTLWDTFKAISQTVPLTTP